KAGNSILPETERDTVQVELLAALEHRERRGSVETRTVREMRGVIDTVELERPGGVSALVCIKGRHLDPDSGRYALPFVLRLYLYAGLERVKMVHTFIYDGEASRDFIKGLGVRASFAMDDAPCNRRVVFAGDEASAWSESVCAVPPMLPLAHYPDINPERARQVAGEVLDRPGGTEAMPLWGRYELHQDSPDHFIIRKGIVPQCSWVDAKHGRRAAGAFALTGADHAVLLGIRDFWRSWPSALCVDDAGGSGDVPVKMTAWMWPPRSEAADLRHYSQKMYGPMYECHQCLDWESGPINEYFSNAHGIARTSELMLSLEKERVTREGVARRARMMDRPATLVCTPQHYHAAGVFGIWSLPDRSTAAKADLEDALERLVDFYLKEVEARRWYGFFNYGDIMHSYDADRHEWRYDEGGYAWDNTELLPGVWLWLCFLRTGRADIFRMAEAMSRHTGEVDIHHIGPNAALGSRHNVTHWGCRAKEPRVSMAGNRRFMYFLTGDERTGEIMREVTEVLSEGRESVTLGPNWSSHCWNWVTAWERSGDDAYRDRILRGIDGLLGEGRPLGSGTLYKLDRRTGELCPESEGTVMSHMPLAFGGPQIWEEIVQLTGHKGFAEALAEYGRHWSLPKEGKDTQEVNLFASFQRAFTAVHEHDRELALKVWKDLHVDAIGLRASFDPDSGVAVQDILLPDTPVTHTNSVSAWSMAVIACLELIGDQLNSARK
ncbi:MAG: hypothetical protein HQL31_07030, partial [Planctomycetes bacterium]|nr:hypothetical protein [Planctomycetota bacterium]